MPLTDMEMGAAGSTGGHEMIENTPESSLISAIKLAENDNEQVVSAYGIQRWSNCDAIVLMTTVPKGVDTVGDWEDNWTAAGASRDGWLWSADLYQVVEDGDGNEVIDIEIIPIFGVGESEVVSIYAYRIDDDVEVDGVNGGAIAFKLNWPIQSASGVKVGFKLVHQRTNVGNFTVISES